MSHACPPSRQQSLESTSFSRVHRERTSASDLARVSSPKRRHTTEPRQIICRLVKKELVLLPTNQPAYFQVPISVSRPKLNSIHAEAIEPPTCPQLFDQSANISSIHRSVRMWSFLFAQLRDRQHAKSHKLRPHCGMIMHKISQV